MIGKILEMTLVAPVKETIGPKLNKLQRGFILSECIAEGLDQRQTLYVTFLDASKAFDVVWHESMLNKLYDLGITGKLW